MVWRGLVVFAMGLGAVALGRDSSVYQIRLDASVPGQAISHDRAHIGGGWSCRAGGALKYSETLKDYKGTPKTLERQDSIQTPASFLANPHMEDFAIVDHDQAGPIGLELTEKCESCTTVMTSSTDANGNTTYSSYEDCDYAWVTWNCPLGRDRRAVGSTTQLDCRVTDEHLYYRRPTEALNKLKANLKVTATLKGTDERVDLDLCKGRTENRSVVRLRQGLGGHEGENDFFVYVKLGDERPVEISTKNGILNEDISFCPYGPKVNVQVWAVEKDLLFSDKYKPVDPDGLNFEVGGGPQSGTVELHRRSYFGWTPKKSAITVDFQGPARFQEVAEAPLAVAPTRAAVSH